MDLRDKLEQAIPRGPETPPAETRVAAGRAALRRRRTAVAAGAAGAVAAVVLPVALLVGGSTTAGHDVDPVAPSPSESASTGGLELRSEVPVSVDRTSRDLLLEEGAVVERREDGLAEGIVGWSAALEVSQDDHHYWVLIGWDETRANVSYDEVEPGQTGFEQWAARGVPRLERQFAPGRAKSQKIPGLRWDGGRFVGSGATEVVEQQPGVDLGEQFAPDEATTGAALVDLGGYRMLVLYRELPGVPGQFLTPKGLTYDGGLDQALDVVRQRYESLAGAR